MPLRTLPISDMHQRHPGLTQALAAAYVEAARVCLDRHHTPPAEFAILKGTATLEVTEVHWTPTDGRARRAWANESDATRDGAYACALAAVELVLTMAAVHRAETLTGADYYIGHPDRSFGDFEPCYRLEVSGIDRGTNAMVGRRLRVKVLQASKGKSSLPAIACVVGFQAAKIAIELVGKLNELESES
jgi:hypothetical protein